MNAKGGLLYNGDRTMSNIRAQNAHTNFIIIKNLTTHTGKDYFGSFMMTNLLRKF